MLFHYLFTHAGKRLSLSTPNKILYWERYCEASESLNINFIHKHKVALAQQICSVIQKVGKDFFDPLDFVTKVNGNAGLAYKIKSQNSTSTKNASNSTSKPRYKANSHSNNQYQSTKIHPKNCPYCKKGFCKNEKHKAYWYWIKNPSNN